MAQMAQWYIRQHRFIIMRTTLDSADANFKMQVLNLFKFVSLFESLH